MNVNTKLIAVTMTVSMSYREQIESAATFDVLLRLSAEQAKNFNATESLSALTKLASLAEHVSNWDQTLKGAHSTVTGLAAQITKYMPNYHESQLADMATAIAYLSKHNRATFYGLFEITAQRYLALRSSTTPVPAPGEITQLAKAFAVMGVKRVDLFDQLAGDSISTLEQFNSSQAAELAWSFAEVNHLRMDLMGSLTEYYFSRKHNFQVEEVSNLLWSFAALNVLNEETEQTPRLKQLVTDIVSFMDLIYSNIGDREVQSRFKESVYYFYQQDPENLAADIFHAHFPKPKAIELPDGKQKINKFTAKVNELLTQNYSKGFIAGIIYVDYYLPLKPLSVVLSCDKLDIRLNDGKSLRGTFLLRDKIAEQAGWHMIRLSWDEWNDADDDQKRAILARELKPFLQGKPKE